MKTMLRLLAAAAPVVLAAAPHASAAPLRPFLFADQGHQAVFLATDHDGDGKISNAEISTFFDRGNASGLPDAGRNVYKMHQASGGQVYISDGNTDTVYVAQDADGDGSANGAGEARVWFSGSGNAAGFTLPTPNGVARGADGAVYVVNAGTGSMPTDYIYRTVDLDGDGSANGAGEAAVWLDLQALNPAASAFEIAFIGETAYIADTVGGQPNVVYSARDTNRDGVVTPDEVNVFIDGNNRFGVSVDFAMDTDEESVYLWQFSGNTRGQSVFRLTDLDGSGAIDGIGEAVEVWNASLLPDPYFSEIGFGMSVGADGSILLTSNAGSDLGRSIFYLLDLDGDGLFFGEGETQVVLNAADSGGFPNRPRNVMHYAPSPIPLPAGLPLMASALLMIAALRRRLV